MAPPSSVCADVCSAERPFLPAQGEFSFSPLLLVFICGATSVCAPVLRHSFYFMKRRVLSSKGFL